MVQGKTKGLTNKTASSRHAAKAAANPKKGQRHIAPKKPALLKSAAMKRDLTAKINKSIETQMVQAGIFWQTDNNEECRHRRVSAIIHFRSFIFICKVSNFPNIWSHLQTPHERKSESMTSIIRSHRMTKLCHI
ncbi:hypothetical protein FPV67DRAFT_1778402 [Lyophyllum atratum]|nr:hypothetical protein FPV67DRAFT_1778402 [Lyophyllum atratum]